MPRLFVTQAKNCNPMYRAFTGDHSGGPFRPTVAEGISLAQPNKGSLVVNAVRETGGRILCAEEEEILAAFRELAANGFYVEPTSSTAYAGLKQLLAEEVISPKDQVVMVVSGNGLKAGEEIAHLL